MSIYRGAYNWNVQERWELTVAFPSYMSHHKQNYGSKRRMRRARAKGWWF